MSSLEPVAALPDLDDRFASPSLKTLRAISQRATAGPWCVPHFVRADTPCNCKYLFGDQGFMGSIATIGVNDGRSIQEGGGDDPPLEEAIANALLIVGAVNYVRARLRRDGGAKQPSATDGTTPSGTNKATPDGDKGAG